MRLLVRLATEPIFHFLALGVAVFALYAVLDEAPPTGSRDRIVVSAETAGRLAAGFEAVWRRPPTPDELVGLIEDHIREEVYVREALALGLDQDDTVIRRRLRQKMEFLSESASAALEPSDAELRAHLEAHPERFIRGPELAFEQVFLGEAPDDREIRTTLDALEAGADPAAVGARTLLPVALPLSPPAAVDGTFGEGFFERVASAEPETWSGPVASGFGAHLIRLDRLVPAVEPSLGTVRDEVLRDWRRAKAEALSEQQFERLRARYEIALPDLSTIEVVQP